MRGGGGGEDWRVVCLPSSCDLFLPEIRGRGAPPPPGSSPRSTTTELSNGSLACVADETKLRYLVSSATQATVALSHSERNSRETVSKIDRARYDGSAIYTWRNETVILNSKFAHSVKLIISIFIINLRLAR